jgi:hypothetical protein
MAIPSAILEIINPFKYVVLIGCSLVGILLLVKLQTKKILSIFSGYVITMFFVITFAVTQLFNVMHAGGANELVSYSSYADTTNTRLVTFDFAVKPSTKIQYEDLIYFVTDPDFDRLEELTSNPNHITYVIVKNKNMINGNYEDKINNKLHLIEKGRKYSLYLNKKLPDKLKRNPYIGN